ncbi:MAG: type II CAAX endopeptidase family protein [Bryobacteraceae bacterium]
MAAIAAVIVAVSCLFIARHYRAAFPQASLDLKLSRTEITARADAFLRERGLATNGYLNLTLFDPDDDVRLFLERSFGLEEANRLMSGTVNVWRWRARWYKPPEKEEMRVWLGTDGKLVGFEHVIPEEAAGKTLEAADARAIAEEFVKKQTQHPLRLVDESAEKRPARLDHTFTWEREGLKLQEATQRWTVVVHGDRLGSYSEFWHLPEKWQRDFETMRSKNSLYANIATGLWLLLVVGTLALTVTALRRHQMQWGTTLKLCLALGAVQMVGHWNQLLLALDAMPTTAPLLTNVLIQILTGVGAGVGALLMVLVPAEPGALLYRVQQPLRVAFDRIFSRGSFQTREFYTSVVVGVAMAAGHLAFVVAFYLLGQKWGVWSPQDVEYSNALSSFLPWLFPFTMSLQAATMEEFWFRLIGVGLLKRWTGSTWIAVIVPAFVWGFLHANYPQQPAWIRGVEVGLIGVVAGVVFLRFGIVATLVWHYTVDATLFSTFLLAEPHWYPRVTGAMISGLALFPLAWGLLRARGAGGFLADPVLLNSAVAEPERPPLPTAVAALDPSPPRLSPMLLYIAAGIALAAGLLLKPTSFGDFVKVPMPRTEAIAIAGEPKDPEKAVADFAENLDMRTFEYLRRQVGRDEAQRLVREFTWTGIWRIRYFKPLQKEERYVYVDSTRKVRRIDWTLDEKAPGAQLPKADALALAQQYLREQGAPLDSLELVDSSEEKRDARVDHQFEWRDKRFRVGEAQARVSLDILGDKPSEYRRYIKLPEAWLREFGRTRITRYLAPGIYGGIFVMALVGFLRLLPRAPIRWRGCAMFAAALVALYALSSLNQVPGFYGQYDTTQPLGDYHTTRALALAGWGVMLAVMAVAGAAAFEVFLWAVQGVRKLRPVSPTVVVALMALLWGGSRVLGWINMRVPGDRYGLPMWNAPDVESAWPWLSAVISSISGGLGGAVGVGLLIAAFLVLIHPERRWWYLGAVAVIGALGNAASVGEFAYSLVSTLAIVALLRVGVLTCGECVKSVAVALVLAQVIRGLVHLWQ